MILKEPIVSVRFESNPGIHPLLHMEAVPCEILDFLNGEVVRERRKEKCLFYGTVPTFI